MDAISCSICLSSVIRRRYALQWRRRRRRHRCWRMKSRRRRRRPRRPRRGRKRSDERFLTRRRWRRWRLYFVVSSSPFPDRGTYRPTLSGSFWNFLGFIFLGGGILLGYLSNGLLLTNSTNSNQFISDLSRRKFQENWPVICKLDSSVQLIPLKLFWCRL